MCGAPETILNLDIQIPNQTRYLGLIGNIAETIAREIDAGGADRETLAYNLNLVVTEAVTNAIQYGSPSDDQDCVRVFLSYENNDLCVRVFDHGEGFDLASVCVPDADDLRERGRGLFFIRALMDTVEYRRIEGGNVLEMKKRLL
jgi:serine/threonine-protein kinase RsbW